MLKFICESIRPNVFKLNNTGNSVGDVISNEPLGNVRERDYFKFEKGRDGIITYMTADDYINHCIHDIFNSTYDKTVTYAVDWNNVDKYAKAMKNGEKFPLCYLDYVTNNQEGRHRALAFKQAFGEDAEMPVLEIYPTNVTDDEIAEYCKQKWGSLQYWYPYVASRLGRTEKEINNYLGIENNEVSEKEQSTEPDNLDNIDDLLNSDDLFDDDESDIDLDDFIDFVNKKSSNKIKSIDDLDAYDLSKWLDKYYRNR